MGDRLRYLAQLPLLTFLLLNQHVDAQDSKSRLRLEKTATLRHSTKLNINNLSTFFRNDGWTDRDPATGNSGLVFPKWSGKTAVFQSGLLFAGKVGTRIGVVGTNYGSSLLPGRILSPGLAEDPNLPKNRIYRVRPDYRTADLSTEITEEGLTEQVIRGQYVRDWNEWPAIEGAPYVDVNGNGVFEPTFDVPGIRGADQTLWFVCHGLKQSLSLAFFGADSLGIEIQTTIWGYNRPGNLGNIIFKRYVFVNKTVTPIDNMYIAQFVDADVGEARDDLVGCDTLLSLGYAYNRTAVDFVYAPLPPPAIGYMILEGPLVESQGAIGRFMGQDVRDHVNLPMTAYFCRFASYPGPQFPNARTSYYQVQGRSDLGTYLTNPLTGLPSRYAFSGDPVSGVGWRDVAAYGHDVRMHISSGPFVMNPGDTNEVVIACVAGGWKDRLSSISAMRSAARLAQRMQSSRFLFLPPFVTVHPTYPPSTAARVKVMADAKSLGVNAMVASLKRESGTVIASLPLFDDGLHEDGGPSDGVFANATSVARELNAAIVDVAVTDSLGGSFVWEDIADRAVLAGRLTLSDPMVFSDNVNGDGKVNPGENVRFGFTLTNSTDFDLHSVRMVAFAETEGKQRQIPTITRGAVDVMRYDPNDEASFLSVDVPPRVADGRFRIAFFITDANDNLWNDTLTFEVHPFSVPVDTLHMRRLSGNSKGEFEIVLADPRQVKPHLYAIRGVATVNSFGDAGIVLLDSTDGRVLLRNQILPDVFGHNVPVTDGFRIRNGTFSPDFGMKGWAVPQGSLRWDSSFTFALGLEGFGGSIGSGKEYWYGGSSVPLSKLRSVLLTFAQTTSSGDLVNPNDTMASFGYRYVYLAARPPYRPEFAPYIVNTTSDFAFQGFARTVPFAAFDVEQSPPRRLAVGFIERNWAGGMVDGKYWPPTDTLEAGGRGMNDGFFIFDAPYSMLPDSILQVDIMHNLLPIMWWGVPVRLPAATFQAGDEFLIKSKDGVDSNDVWTFTPAFDQIIPESFDLFQNFPNPFNSNTTIFYQLRVDSKVRLRIYNILGQEVRTLVDDVQAARNRIVQWDGANNERIAVASGVYFYRLEATGVGQPHQAHVQTKKMLVLR